MGRRVGGRAAPFATLPTLRAGAEHVSLRSLPGMADWCLRCGSAGKTFSFTAWKVGLAGWWEGRALWKVVAGRDAARRRQLARCWVERVPAGCPPPHPPAQVGWITGPRDLVAAVTKAKQFLTFTSARMLSPIFENRLRRS